MGAAQLLGHRGDQPQRRGIQGARVHFRAQRHAAGEIRALHPPEKLVAQRAFACAGDALDDVRHAAWIVRGNQVHRAGEGAQFMPAAHEHRRGRPLQGVGVQAHPLERGVRGSGGWRNTMHDVAFLLRDAASVVAPSGAQSYLFPAG